MTRMDSDRLIPREDSLFFAASYFSADLTTLASVSKAASEA